MSQCFHTTVGAAGRVVIPAEVRRALHLQEGDGVVFEFDGQRVTIASQEAALRDAQAFFREGLPAGASLVDELFAERRAEAAREQSESGE